MYIHLLSGKGFTCRAQVIAPRECCALSSARAGVIPQCIQCWQPGRDVANGWSLLITVSELTIHNIAGAAQKSLVMETARRGCSQTWCLPASCRMPRSFDHGVRKGCNELF